VTPVTPPARLATLAQASQGFVYAVTMTGTTGGAVEVPDGTLAYLDRVRAAAGVPVCAGFGIRDAAQVAALTGHADGVIVGSALVEAVESGRPPGDVLRGLRSAAYSFS
jgi:tryptophan synthase alpha chain